LDLRVSYTWVILHRFVGRMYLTRRAVMAEWKEMEEMRKGGQQLEV
jgi:hypothetical protein